MKIQSIRPRIGRCTRRRRHRLAAICSAVLIGAATSAAAPAQSPQAGAPSVAGSAHTSVAAQGGALTHGGESFRVIGSSSVPTAAGPGEEIIQIEPGEEFVEWENGPPPGVAGHGGHPGHAGRGHGGHPHRGHGPAPGAVHGAIQSGLHGHAGACGPSCQPYHYVTVEGLYMQQSEYDDYRFDTNTVTDEFDYEWAPRVTIGSVPDCVNGWEASFTGPLEWEMDGTFDDNEFYEAEYWSAEINRTHIAWDAAKLLLGVRYIDYEEELRSTTESFESEVENSLIGIHIGADILYPVARHVSADFRGRAGAYLNLVDADVDDDRDGRNFDRDDEEIAGVFEIGTGLRYHFSDMLSVRGGGELWYLAGMATAPGHITSGRSEVDADDDIFIYGLTATAELRF